MPSTDARSLRQRWPLGGRAQTEHGALRRMALVEVLALKIAIRVRQLHR
jgi:hypothetical protein